MPNKTFTTFCHCLNKTDGIHTCAPSVGWRKLENQAEEEPRADAE